MSRSAPALLKRLDVPAAVALSLLVQTIIALLAASIPVLAPEIATDRGWNVDMIAFYAPILYLAAFFFSFQIPRILQQLGGMGLSLLCLAFSALGLLCLLPPSIALAVAAPLALGAANGGMNPASSQVLGPRTSARNAGIIMSIKQTGVPLGGMLAGVLVPILVLRSGWQGAVLSLAGASALAAIALLPTVRWLNGARGSGQLASFRPLEPVKRIWAMPGMRSFIAAAMTFVAMQQCLRSFFTVYLVSALGFSLTTAGLAFGASQGAGIVGQILWAFAADRLIRPHAVMAIIGVVMSIAALLTATFSSEWPVTAIVAVAMLYGLSAAGFIPVVLGEVARRSAPGEVGALTAGANTYLIVSMLVGPLVFGAVASALGYAAAFTVFGMLSLAGAAIALPRAFLRNLAATGKSADRRTARGATDIEERLPR